MFHETKKIKISLRLDYSDPDGMIVRKERLQSQFANLFLRPGMRRKNNSVRAREIFQSFEDFREAFPLIYVGSTMQGQQRILAAFQSQPLRYRRQFCPRFIFAQRVNHCVADEVNPACRNTFGTQIPYPTLLGYKEQVRNLIGEDAIDFLRHRAIKRSQSGFDMRNGGPTFSPQI